jgi:hypothetical protein
MTSAAKTAATMMKPAAIRKRSTPRLVMTPTLSANVRPHGDKVGPIYAAASTSLQMQRPRTMPGPWLSDDARGMVG